MLFSKKECYNYHYWLICILKPANNMTICMLTANIRMQSEVTLNDLFMPPTEIW